MTRQESQDLAAIARRRLALIHDHPVKPAETAYEHVANAIQLLMAHEREHPAVWLYSPELPAVQARLFHALFLLGGETT